MIPALVYLLYGALAVITVYEVVKIVKLTINVVKNWFAKHKNLNANEIGFTLKKEIDNGNYSYVQGVFNPRTEVITDMVNYEIAELDETLKRIHLKNDLLIHV